MSTDEGSGSVVREPRNQSRADRQQFERMGELFMSADGELADRIDAFPKFASRQAIAKFLARAQIFQHVLDVHGSVIECGVLHGAGLFTFAKLSAILEPTNHTRRIIGFDTFQGFVAVADVDRGGASPHSVEGGLVGSSVSDVARAIDVFDLNRPLSHIPKIELVEGDLRATAPTYVEAHPALVVALLYLDVDLYEPTRAAIEAFLPRMPRGAVIAFDELHAEIFPGETQAVVETLGLGQLRLRRFPYEPYVSYAVIE